MKRRDFLKLGIAAGSAVVFGLGGVEARSVRLPKRKLGRTGEELSILGMGGIVLCGNDQHAADRIVGHAFDRGVNYFDVAPSYGNGEAEKRLGPALKPYRSRAFLACKTTKRDKVGAAEELRSSLKRLQTDHVDLYQMHGLTSVDEVRTALGPGGAIEAFNEAKKQGLVRFLGFSCHSVEAAVAAMDGFSFDTILFPVNYVCYLKGDFGPQVIEKARSRGMGILALKAMARTAWPADSKRDYPKCWYQPLSDPSVVDLALRFTLSEPVTSALPPGDERLFELALSVAERFKPLTQGERKELEAAAASLQPIFHYPSA